MPRKVRPPFDRWIEKVDVDLIGCWIWTACTSGQWGYGWFRTGTRIGGRESWDYAHRFSYKHFIGDIPEGLSVLHHCDVPLCVRPDHLFVGTQADNIADMTSKGRGSWQKVG